MRSNYFMAYIFMCDLFNIIFCTKKDKTSCNYSLVRYIEANKEIDIF